MNRPAAFPIAPGTADAEVMLRILRERRADHTEELLSPRLDERRSDLLRGCILQLDEFIDWLTQLPG